MNPIETEHGLRFDLQGEQPAAFIIEQATGDLNITGWDVPAILITGGDGDESEDLGEFIQAEQNDNTVTVKLHLPGKRFEHRRHHNHEDINEAVDEMMQAVRKFGRGLNLDLNIQVPHQCNITVRTASGDIHLNQIEGKLYIQTASGDVALHEIGGNVLVQTASADVLANRVRGRFGVRTMSGDLTIQEGVLSALSAATVSGDVTIQAALHPATDYEIQTVSGDVELQLPQDIRAAIEVETVSGDIECTLPHRAERRGRRHRSLTINGGGDVHLRVRTTSGDMNFKGGNQWGPGPAEDDADEEVVASETRRFSPDESAEARAAMQGAGSGDAARVEGDSGMTQRLDARSAERTGPRKSPEMAILEAIENGAMSVDEGLRRLNELAQ